MFEIVHRSFHTLSMHLIVEVNTTSLIFMCDTIWIDLSQQKGSSKWNCAIITYPKAKEYQPKDMILVMVQ
jgi:hypothetical protein